MLTVSSMFDWAVSVKNVLMRLLNRIEAIWLNFFQDGFACFSSIYIEALSLFFDTCRKVRIDILFLFSHLLTLIDFFFDVEVWRVPLILSIALLLYVLNGILLHFDSFFFQWGLSRLIDHYLRACLLFQLFSRHIYCYFWVILLQILRLFHTFFL